MSSLNPKFNWAGEFKTVEDPTGLQTVIPDDIDIVFPEIGGVDNLDTHFLAYIPWQEKYLMYVPAGYRAFYSSIVSQLAIRTTDVHTALSVSQLPSLLADVTKPVNEHVLTLAILLHDCGWSEVTVAGIINSLNYSSVAPPASSRKSKQQHVIFGEALAYKILDSYDFAADDLPPLNSDDIFQITEIIRRHDFDAPWESNKFGPISLETKLVCDCDRLWSYTHENFWQDTIRKAVTPETYIQNLDSAIEDYFFTAQGKSRAHQLLTERQNEVNLYLEALK